MIRKTQVKKKRKKPEEPGPPARGGEKEKGKQDPFL